LSVSSFQDSWYALNFFLAKSVVLPPVNEGTVSSKPINFCWGSRRYCPSVVYSQSDTVIILDLKPLSFTAHVSRIRPELVIIFLTTGLIR
jgi:hypothetical protein